MTIYFSELVLTIMMAVLMTACGNNSSKLQQYNRLTQSDSTHIDSVVASYMRDHIETVIEGYSDDRHEYSRGPATVYQKAI